MNQMARNQTWDHAGWAKAFPGHSTCAPVTQVRGCAFDELCYSIVVIRSQADSLLWGDELEYFKGLNAGCLPVLHTANQRNASLSQTKKKSNFTSISGHQDLGLQLDIHLCPQEKHAGVRALKGDG